MKYLAIIIINKWDLLRDKEGARREYATHVRSQLKFLDFVPVEYVSSKTGYKVDTLLKLILQVFAERAYRFTTHQLMEIIKSLPLQHSTPSKGKRKLKLKFAVQAKGYPPTFAVFVNDENLVHFSYERYLENAIRERHKFLGTPLKFIWKKNQGTPKVDRKRKNFNKKTNDSKEK